MQKITTYRDTPKRGETDAGWCGYITEPNGHILTITTGHESEAAAREWLIAHLKCRASA